MREKATNVWGEEVKERWRRDPWHVPKKQRLDRDQPHEKHDNALDDETGDDLDGWKPGDPVE